MVGHVGTMGIQALWGYGDHKDTVGTVRTMGIQAP